LLLSQALLHDLTLLSLGHRLALLSLLRRLLRLGWNRNLWRRRGGDVSGCNTTRNSSRIPAEFFSVSVSRHGIGATASRCGNLFAGRNNDRRLFLASETFRRTDGVGTGYDARRTVHRTSISAGESFCRWKLLSHEHGRHTGKQHQRRRHPEYRSVPPWNFAPCCRADVFDTR
jgi:hypothetical protein